MLNAVVILAFTLPKAYELKKDEVDSFASQAHHHTKVALARTAAHDSGRAFEICDNASCGSRLLQSAVPALLVADVEECLCLLSCLYRQVGCL